jgi:hypothetical protein
MKLSSLALPAAATLVLAVALASCSSNTKTTTSSDSTATSAMTPEEKVARGKYMVSVLGLQRLPHTRRTLWRAGHEPHALGLRARLDRARGGRATRRT